MAEPSATAAGQAAIVAAGALEREPVMNRRRSSLTPQQIATICTLRPAGASWRAMDLGDDPHQILTQRVATKICSDQDYLLGNERTISI